MDKKQSRWLLILAVMSLFSVTLYTPKAHADSGWMKYFKKDSLLNTYKTCYAVQEDVLWQGTYGDGVIINDGKTQKTISNKNSRSTPPVNDGLVSDYITCITIDEMRGRVWIGTNEGLSSCNLEAKEWNRYTEGKDLPNNIIRAMTMDDSGNLWVGTPSGVVMFDGETWKKFDESNGLLQASVHSIKSKGNSIWVGTIGGSVSRYKDGQWQTVVCFD